MRIFRVSKIHYFLNLISELFRPVRKQICALNQKTTLRNPVLQIPGYDTAAWLMYKASDLWPVFFGLIVAKTELNSCYPFNYSRFVAVRFALVVSMTYVHV